MRTVATHSFTALIILAIIFYSCSPKKIQESPKELIIPEPVTETAVETKSPEPNKLYSKLFGQWYTQGNEGLEPYWLEFTMDGQFYTWVEEERPDSSSGRYKLASETLQLSYDKFDDLKIYVLDFDGSDRLLLIPTGSGSRKLNFSKRNYVPPPKAWMIPEQLTVDKLEGGKWLNSNFDGCTAYYLFKDENRYFEHFNCSMDELDTGRFEIINDTLKVYEYHLISEVPRKFGGVEGTEVRHEYHYILNQNNLRITFFRDHRHDSEISVTDTLHQYTRN